MRGPAFPRSGIKWSPYQLINEENMTNLQFGTAQFPCNCETFQRMDNGYLLESTNISVQLPAGTKAYYTHGWQSWSLAGWTGLQALPVSKPALLHPLQVDPVYARHPHPNGSWVGAVELADGNILLLGALGLDSHVQLRERQLQGWYENAASDGELQQWFIAHGPENEVFQAYAHFLGERLGKRPAQATQQVWCSWYSFYTAIDEQVLHATFARLADVPFDVLQVDDGWQLAIGDWEPNAKFPSGMEGLTTTIRATGRKAGLWLAPLLVVPSSKLYNSHPDWVLQDENGKPISAGFNWGEPLYALDTTHPLVLGWLANLMRQVRSWGFDYVKLDFLYAGALPGKRYQSKPRETAYRDGLTAIRAGLGADAYLLTCGAPILPSLGLSDALRIGPDVAALWESQRDAVFLYNPATPSAKNAIRTSINRMWLAPLVHTDPDVAYFCTRGNSLEPGQMQLLQDLAAVCRFKATSDLPQFLTKTEREALVSFLQHEATIQRVGRNTFLIDGRKVDFSQAMTLPSHPTGITALLGEIAGWLGSQPFVLRLLGRLDQARLKKLVIEINNQK